MSVDEELRVFLKELSSAISQCLSTPENLEKLEKLQRSGFDLYLLLETSDDSSPKISPTPILPIQLESVRSEPKQSARFELTSEDKDFLRTLKIKVD